MSTTTAPPRIDPRIRARRIAVQRDEGRRRLRRVGVVTAVASAVIALWGLTQTPLLDVDHLDVQGAVHTGSATVELVSGVRHGDALLTARLGRAAHRIAALPWVRTVEVHRRWPGTVVVDVVERQPVAAVPALVPPATTPVWLLLDATGRQLAVQPDTPRGVPLLQSAPVGVELGAVLHDRTAAPLRLAATLPTSLRGRLVGFQAAAGGAVEGTVLLRDGSRAQVLFGRPSQAAAKWLALLSVLDETAPGGLVRIDVRVPSVPALTRR